MGAHRPENVGQRARTPAHERGAEVDDAGRLGGVRRLPYSDVLTLGRAGRVVGAVVVLAMAAFLVGIGFALASVVGPVALDWLVGGVVIVLVLATAAVSAHAGGHAWFVPLPAAALAFVWLLSVSGHSRHASSWWLLAASAACSLVAVLFATSILLARAASDRRPAASLVGADGVAVTPLSPVGIARVGGETWTAESISGPLAAGAELHVVRVEGLRLLVWSEHGHVPGAEILPGQFES